MLPEASQGPGWAHGLPAPDMVSGSICPCRPMGKLVRVQRLKETLRVGRDKFAEQEEALKLCKILKTHS